MTTSELKGRFFQKKNRFESIRIANWNAPLELLTAAAGTVRHTAIKYYKPPRFCDR